MSQMRRAQPSALHPLLDPLPALKLISGSRHIGFQSCERLFRAFYYHFPDFCSTGSMPPEVLYTRSARSFSKVIYNPFCHGSCRILSLRVRSCHIHCDHGRGRQCVPPRSIGGQGDAMERMAKIGVIAFDKTSIITTGQLEVSAINSYNSNHSQEKLLEVAASAESMSEHPLGKCICRRFGATPSVPEDFVLVPDRE